MVTRLGSCLCSEGTFGRRDQSEISGAEKPCQQGQKGRTILTRTPNEAHQATRGITEVRNLLDTGAN